MGHLGQIVSTPQLIFIPRLDLKHHLGAFALRINFTSDADFAIFKGRLMESNFDRLRSNYTQYVTYWQTPCILLQKLNTLGPRLERLRSPPQEGPHPWMRPGPPRRTQSALPAVQEFIQEKNNSHDSPMGSYGRHSISIPKDMPSPFQPFLGLQQQDQTGSFLNGTNISWPTRFDDTMADNAGFVPLPTDVSLDNFDFGLADNLDLPFSLANVLNWHSVE